MNAITPVARQHIHIERVTREHRNYFLVSYDTDGEQINSIPIPENTAHALLDRGITGD